ncbi:MAG: carbohydrate porin, partial [Proteobacteria bacterium]|nr:carbohydrate porin [Pseudomonadota bacterium]
MLLPITAVLSTMTYNGEVTASGGDYVDIPFEVPAGTKEIAITHADGGTAVILDWGVWSPTGYRGWGGGNTEDITIGEAESSRSYLPGPIEPGTWHLIIGKAKLAGTGNTYTADVTCVDTATLAPRPRAAYTPTVLSTTRRWYAGDFHVHSTESGDAQASFAEIRALAKTQRLDFVNLSDHNTMAQHALIAAVQPTVPDLLFLRGPAASDTTRATLLAVDPERYRYADGSVGFQAPGALAKYRLGNEAENYGELAFGKNWYVPGIFSTDAQERPNGTPTGPIARTQVRLSFY